MWKIFRLGEIAAIKGLQSLKGSVLQMTKKTKRFIGEIRSYEDIFVGLYREL